MDCANTSLKRRASGSLTENLLTCVDSPPPAPTPLTKRQKICSEAGARHDIKRPSLARRSKFKSNSISPYVSAFASTGSTAFREGSGSFLHFDFRHGPEHFLHGVSRSFPMECLMKFLNKDHICSPSDLGSYGRSPVRPHRNRVQTTSLPPLRHHVRGLPPLEPLDQPNIWISLEGPDHPRTRPTVVGPRQPRESSPYRSASMGNHRPGHMPEHPGLYEGARHCSTVSESVTAPAAMRFPVLRLQTRGCTMESPPSGLKHTTSPLSSAPSSPFIQTPREESYPSNQYYANSPALPPRGILPLSRDWSSTLNIDGSAGNKTNSETSQWSAAPTSPLSSRSISSSLSNREDVPVYWQSGSTPFVLPSEFSELIVHQTTVMGNEEVARVMVAPSKPQRREKTILEDGEMLKSSVTYPLE
ncbi:hypothetical protein BKA70DRAFT_682319 [Coprinopsis sp. MPI-PUGE-AT-0042]|nr:hypothetical protein BKA70DRAFT_682319 [Coprinopsis sp. MPI-PUGE-AT-0042]